MDTKSCATKSPNKNIKTQIKNKIFKLFLRHITCEYMYSEKRKFQLKQINKTTTNDDMPARVVDIMIWDTAGQEEYRSLNHKY